MCRQSFRFFSNLPVLLTLFVITAGCSAEQSSPKTPPPPADAKRPNIIYVMVDDMGYGDLGITGQTNFTTPHIDRMAAQGLFFTNAYNGSTVCAPSRAALLAGQHTGHLYQRGNGGPITFRKDPKDITIATLLKQAGYTTAMFGKSGLSCNTDDGGHVLDKGFDYFYGETSHVVCHRHYPTFIWRNDQKETLEGNHGETGEQYLSEICMTDALRWIQEAGKSDKPFFAHIALTPPHADLEVPEKYRAPYMGKWKETPNRGGYSKQKHPKATYAGMINFIDQKMGELMAELEAQGLAENTVVFFSSDNGPSAEGGKPIEALDSNGPLRGGKRDLYEGGIRTPLIVWWPGTVKAGQTSDMPTAMWDFMPTALTLAGAAIPEWTDGLSLTPTLYGLGDQPQHEYLYWEFYEQGGKQAVRYGKWKGVRLNVGKNRNAPIELYDLTRDIGEKNNVASQHPDVVRKIAGFMEEAHTPAERFTFERGFIPMIPKDRFLPKADLIDNKHWKVIDFSSESGVNGAVATNAIDGDIRSRWHTRWDGAQPPHPHHITVDLGRSEKIAGVRILPRQDDSSNGRVEKYEVYVSNDPDAFGKPVAKGTLKNTYKEQEIRFTQQAIGRYIKIVALSEPQGQPFTSIAELRLLAK